MRRSLPAILVFALAALGGAFACGSRGEDDTATAAPASLDGGADAAGDAGVDDSAADGDATMGDIDAANDAGDADAGPALPDPSAWDCTRTKDPDRVASTPIGCAMDPKCPTRMVSAHRGAGGQLGKIAPEDTLAAYRAGIAIGVDFVETDPRPTADGKLVNIHDATVDRTTDGTGTVSDMTFDQVRALHIKAGTLAGDYSCEKVPTLEELLSVCKGKAVVLVDGNKTDRVDLLVAAIQSTGTIEWALFDTSHLDRIDAALAIEPTLHIQVRVDSPDSLDLALTHLAAHPPDMIEIESTATDLAGLTALVHQRGGRALLDTFPQDLAFNLDGMIDHYADAFGLGIDVAQTDRPDAVLRFLGR